MDNRYLPAIISFLEDNHNSRLFDGWQSFNGSITLYMNGSDSYYDNIPLYSIGHGSSINSLGMIVYNNYSEKLYPSGTSTSSGIWRNSDNNTSDMFSYIDDDPYNSLEDSNWIASYQSGYYVQPNNLYWVADGGIHKLNLTSNNITRILDGNNDTELSSHIAYSDIDDFIYYGVENGNTGYLKRIDGSGLRNTTSNSNFGAGLGFSYSENKVFSLSKDGLFKSSYADYSTATTLTSLLGRETLSRRIRINQDTQELYALQTEATSYLTKVYKYNHADNTWDYLRILSYGMFGGAFDIDYASGNIYYTATSDYFTPSYYGIVKESLVSGSGTRIITPSPPTYFQTKELLFNQHNRQLYYVAEDVSGIDKIFKLNKCDDLGGGVSTLVSLPESSGIKAMAFDGGLYRSYIDFDLTDLTTELANNGSSSLNISSAFLTVRASNHNDFSYIRAKLLTGDKTDYIWYPNYSDSTTKIVSSGGISVYNIGLNSSTINTSRNTSTDWNNSVLRLEVAASPSGNQDVTKIYSAVMNVFSTTVLGTPILSSIPLYMNSYSEISDGIPLHMVSDASVASIPMYLLSGVTNSGDITQYTYGHVSLNDSVTMYIHGAIPSSDFPMYGLGHDYSSGNVTMFIDGLGVNNVELPMYIDAGNWTGTSGEIPLFMYSSDFPSLFKTVDLYINSTADTLIPENQLNLYIEGYGGIPRSSSMNLYLKSETPSLGQGFDMTVGNYYSSSTNSASMYLEGPLGPDGALYSSGTLNLFLALIENHFDSIPMYVKVDESIELGLPMFLEGQPKEIKELTMYVSGIEPQINTAYLYTHGF